MQKLNDDDRARLRADFVVPTILSQMMAGMEPLDDVAEYTVHDIIGDLRPDGGLICVALSALEIAAYYPHMPIAGALALEAERVIAEFGAHWLRAEDADVNAVRQSLVHIPEDLESIADLLDATQAAMDHADIVGRTLCDMLALQARAHAETAEEELYNINLMPLSREHIAAESGGARIIPFPARP